MDQNFKFGGTIGYEDSYLEYSIRHFKVFRLHAILHDAAGGVRAHSDKVPAYCYSDWTRTTFIFAQSRDWITLLPLPKNLSALHFQIC